MPTELSKAATVNLWIRKEYEEPTGLTPGAATWLSMGIHITQQQ